MARGCRGEDHPLAASCYHHRPSHTLPLRRHIRPRGITSFFRGHVRAYYSVVSSTWRSSLSTIRRDRWLHPENVETRVWRKSAQLNISSHAYDVTLTSLARILTDCWLNGSDMHFAMLIFMLSLVISEEGRVLVRAIKGHSCGRARMARTGRLAKYLLRNISLFLVYNTSTLKLKLQKSDYPNHYMIKQNRSWCRPWRGKSVGIIWLRVWTRGACEGGRGGTAPRYKVSAFLPNHSHATASLWWVCDLVKW